MLSLSKLILVLFVPIFSISCSNNGPTPSNSTTKPPPEPTSALQWITKMMDKYHETFDVYTDVGSGGNHFPVKAKMWGKD